MQECALRELKEETGIVADSCEKICDQVVEIQVGDGSRTIREHVFLATSSTDVVELTEGQGYEWMTLDEYLTRKVPIAVKEYIEKYRERFLD